MEAHQWICCLRQGIQAKGGFEMIHGSSHLKVSYKSN